MKVIIYVGVTIGTGLRGRRKTGERRRVNEDGRRRSGREAAWGGGLPFKNNVVLFKGVKNVVLVSPMVYSLKSSTTEAFQCSTV